MIKQLLLSAVCVATVISCSNNNPQKSLNYLSMNKPDTTLKLFAPGTVSRGLYERDFTINPDGTEIFYSIMSRNYSVIVTSKLVNNKWSQPEVAHFSGSTEYFDAEPHITPDGKHLMFLSTRAPEGMEQKEGWHYQNIWVCDKTNDGWSKPYNLGKPINTDSGEYFPSVTNSGTLYFTREEANGEQYIYRSEMVNGKYQEPEKLPKQINRNKFQYNACIAPDESYIILCTNITDGKSRRTDYAISYRSDNDTWSELTLLGNNINYSGSHALSPYITPDGKYLFFSQSRQNSSTITRYNTTDMYKAINEPQNGNSDIYWISTEAFKYRK